MKIEKRFFGLLNGEIVYLYTLTNDNGFSAQVMPYGASLVAIYAPDNQQNFSDCILGFDNFEAFLAPHPCMGATVGRFANRLKNGKYTIDGETFQTSTNWKNHSLHGGFEGFDKKLWLVQAEEILDNSTCIQFFYLSSHREEGFSGNLKMAVTYAVTNNNELKIKYEAKTDAPTVINFTNHAYFNLANSGDIQNHVLQLDADKFTVADEDLIPTGELRNVRNTAFDFTTPKTIGEGITENQGGFDTNFVLNDNSNSLRKVGELSDPESGRVMEIWTTEAGLQLFTLDFDGSLFGKTELIKGYAGVCLETQNFPDAPNQSNFPSAVLRPDEKFESETIYKFKVK